MKEIKILETIKVEKEYRLPLSKFKRWICNVFNITPMQGDFACDIEISVSEKDARYLCNGMVLLGFSGELYRVLSKVDFSLTNTVVLRSNLYVMHEERYGFVIIGCVYSEN